MPYPSYARDTHVIPHVYMGHPCHTPRMHGIHNRHVGNDNRHVGNGNRHVGNDNRHVGNGIDRLRAGKLASPSFSRVPEVEVKVDSL